MRDYEFIGQRLSCSTRISTSIGIYHCDIPETDTRLPVINYFLISRPFESFGLAERPRYQISCRAATPAQAMNLAHEVHSVFNNFQGSTGSFDVQNCKFENSRMIIEQNSVYNVPVDIFISYINMTST